MSAPWYVYENGETIPVVRESALTAERAKTAALDAEVARLSALVYVPGCWRCAKCAFAVIRSVMNVNDGTMTANNEPEACPNGCGPLWRVTEREQRKDAFKTCDDLFDKGRALEKEVAAYKQALQMHVLRAHPSRYYQVRGDVETINTWIAELLKGDGNV